MSSTAPERYILMCPAQCSYHPDKAGPGLTAAINAMREKGHGSLVIQKRVQEIVGHPVNRSSLDRHFTHMKDAVGYVAPGSEDLDDAGENASDVQILEDIIKRAHANRKSWRPTIKDALEAMKLKNAMTGQSAFENMLNAMAAADADVGTENPEAEGVEDERVEESA